MRGKTQAWLVRLWPCMRALVTCAGNSSHWMHGAVLNPCNTAECSSRGFHTMQHDAKVKICCRCAAVLRGGGAGPSAVSTYPA